MVFSSLSFSLADLTPRSVALGAALLVFCLLARGVTKKKSKYPLPPGPPRKPFFGNYFDLPEREGWFLPKLYRDLSQSFGSDLLYLKLFGTNVVIVNTAEAANELFQRRAHNYANRPALNAFHKVIRMEWFTAVMQPDERWKSYRKAFGENFKTLEYRGVELRSAHSLLRAFLTTPDDFLAHFRRMNTATTMAITYGIDMADGTKEHLVDVGKRIVATNIHASSTFALVLDALPALISLPGWLAGGKYKREAVVHAKSARDMNDVPFQEMEKLISEGRAKPSIVYNMLNRATTKEEEKTAKDTGGNVFFSASNNVNSPLGAFVMAMAKYPEIQRRAQKEVDDVVGSSRLPDFSDLPSLPFVDAIVKELIRWRPLAPLVTPHAAAEDDVYKGYFIPKGTVVIGNAWAIFRDEKIYPDPETFNPDRWFSRPAGEFPFATFGFGRRLCPGIAYTRDMLNITIASILATYNIEFPTDSAGNTIVAEEAWTPTLFSYIEPFKAKITPRSPAAKELILTTVSEEPLTEG